MVVPVFQAGEKAIVVPGQLKIVNAAKLQRKQVALVIVQVAIVSGAGGGAALAISGIAGRQQGVVGILGPPACADGQVGGKICLEWTEVKPLRGRRCCKARSDQGGEERHPDFARVAARQCFHGLFSCWL
jgi:hypothetical protein